MGEAKEVATIVQIDPVDCSDLTAGLGNWVTRQLEETGFVLAHFDDGVVWGKLIDSALVTSNEFAPEISPPFRLDTLQQAFIFGKRSEIRLWKDELDNWKARRVSDVEDNTGDNYRFDEYQILWGTKLKQECPNDFSWISEARQQGMEHVVPVKVDDAQLKARQLRLHVRHFINCDGETGQARVFLSRLVDVLVGPGEK
jgi:CRISPR-associated protein (TIGR03984 family)